MIGRIRLCRIWVESLYTQIRNVVVVPWYPNGVKLQKFPIADH